MERAGKTEQDNGMVWYVLLNQHFFYVLTILDSLYLEKFSSKHIKPYHFLDQFFELIPLVPFIYTFEKL